MPWCADRPRLPGAGAIPARIGPGQRLCLALLLLCGVQQVADAAWIEAKARLAQYLIADAWRRTSVEAAPGRVLAVRPWPWSDTWPVARLQAPRQGIELYVLNSDSGQALAFGPGHLARSALPGEGGTSIIAGHRDTHFAFLPRLQVGDPLVFELPDGRRHTFRIDSTRVVDSRQQPLRAATSGQRRTVLLVSCYPFDTVIAGGPLRYLVNAVAADPVLAPAS